MVSDTLKMLTKLRVLTAETVQNHSGGMVRVTLERLFVNLGPSIVEDAREESNRTKALERAFSSLPMNLSLCIQVHQ